jgi:hypothetical protein
VGYVPPRLRRSDFCAQHFALFIRAESGNGLPVRRRKIFCIHFIVGAFTLATTILAGRAASIAPGNLVIYRVGNGPFALSTSATAVFLEEYTPGGTLVQTIALSTNGSTAFTAVGNATTEGIISRSQDGAFLIFTGYRKTAGGTSPAADSPSTVNRVIGTLNAAGVVNTTTALTNGAAFTIRSATSVNGTSAFWVSGSVNVSYDNAPFVQSSNAVIDARNSRQVNMSGNTLYAANGSTTIANKLQSYGTLPTNTTAPTAVVTLALSDAINSFVILDLNPSVAGDDTIYAMSTVENLLRKYSFDGTNWTSRGSISAGGGANITGYVANNVAVLYVTSASSLFSFSDASGPIGTISGSLGSAIATAGFDTAFRGIGMFPPAMAIRRADTNVVVSWRPTGGGFVLQTATNITGSWSNSSNQANPQTNSVDNSASALFYRLK